MTDLNFAFRQLIKNPGFTIVAVLTLAIGIGANTAIFSTLDAVLFRPLPYSDPDRLVQLYETLPKGDLNNVSGGVFLDWRKHQTQFESIALITEVTRNLRTDSAADRLNGLEATHEFLRVLGIQPLLGRGFLPDDERFGGDNQVVMLTEELWQSRFGRSTLILGHTLVLDEVPYVVIGVLPRGTLPHGIWSQREALFVVPAVPKPEAGGKYSRSFHWAAVYGRLKPKATILQADTELKTIKEQVDRDYPGYKREWSATVRSLHDRLSSGPRPVLLMLAGAVAFVLLIACANVANLLLARATVRRQEIALRMALGANGRRIVRQVMTESLALAAIGGAAGTVLSVWGIHLLRRLTFDILPGAMAPQLDGRVLAFSLLLAVCTGLLFGILPGLAGSRFRFEQGTQGRREKHNDRRPPSHPVHPCRC